MIIRMLLFIIGISLCSISCAFLIIYLNLMNMGYTFHHYVNFIIRRIEIIGLIPGIICIILSMKKQKGK